MSFPSNGLSGVSLGMYLHAWIINLCLALPLQLIIVGPICRSLLSKIQGKR
ncbi:DUF2798 domain-containing protein [Lactobacillus sp. Sy-1]|uniref:DUF2798 domain-containing protein n=1 Tax=Lactobacillus sp. Sy-1 TaxID=2109645 RepID=UPI001C5B6B5D|nr:DUF2798 domain-containing protein [Lactobacillus sp. Sy-1]